MKFSYLLYAVLLYVLYKIIFRFIIPVYKTTKHIKKQFGAMQEQMQEQFGGFATPQTNPEPVKEQKPNVKKEYIDFEETK